MPTAFSSTKNDASESTFKKLLRVECAVGLHMLLIHSSCFSVGLILLVENCVALPHRQDRCHVGPAAPTASLLLKVFRYFAFNTEGLQLISTISWTKGDR